MITLVHYTRISEASTIKNNWRDWLVFIYSLYHDAIANEENPVGPVRNFFNLLFLHTKICVLKSKEMLATKGIFVVNSLHVTKIPS